MLYYLFQYLEQIDVPGARLMNYLTFRSGMALILSLFIAAVDRDAACRHGSVQG